MKNKSSCNRSRPVRCRGGLAGGSTRHSDGTCGNASVTKIAGPPYGFFAELVCSNSFRAANVENAVGLLKEEMRRLGSLIMEAADATRVPAGGALAVDRVPFSEYVTEKIKNHPLITITHEEVTEIPEIGLALLPAAL